jgi:hypothetical protein
MKLKNQPKLALLFLLLVLTSCGTSVYLKSVKQEDYNLKLNKVLVVISSEYGTEYNNDFEIYIREKLYAREIKNNSISFDKLSLNDDEVLKQKIKEYQPNYILNIFQRKIIYGSQVGGEFGATILDTNTNLEIWKSNIYYSEGTNNEVITNKIISELEKDNLINVDIKK